MNPIQDPHDNVDGNIKVKYVNQFGAAPVRNVRIRCGLNRPIPSVMNLHRCRVVGFQRPSHEQPTLRSVKI